MRSTLHQDLVGHLVVNLHQQDASGHSRVRHLNLVEDLAQFVHDLLGKLVHKQSDPFVRFFCKVGSTFSF